MKYLDSLIAQVRQKNCILVFSNLNRAILNIVLWRFPFKKKFWFENFRNSTCLGNGTFQLYRPDSSDRAFNYFSCKQDKKERYWGQQFKKWKGTFRSGPTEMSGPVKEDHLWRWSKIFRSDLTKMVRSAWFLTWFPEFWTEWKARSCKILSHMESTLKRCSHSRQPLSVVDPAEGPGGGGPGPPYFWTKLRPEEPKKFFFSRPGPPLSQGLDDRLPLSEGLMTFDIANLNCSCWTVELVFLSIDANRHFLLWFCGIQSQWLHLNSCYNSYIATKNDCNIQISLELVLLADYVRQAISVVGISAVPSSRILSSRKRRLDGFSRLVDSDIPFRSM